MTPRPITFCVPGDIAAQTGGYLYDRRLIEGLRAAGRKVSLLSMPPGFPAPSPAEMAEALAGLRGIPAGHVAIIDGLGLGALETAGLAEMVAPFTALIHHPLAMESGLAPARRDHLHRTERANLRLARHVLVPSPHIAALLTAEYGVPAEKITVARPGTDRPVAMAREPAMPPLILSVGLLHPRKGHDVLIAALRRIADRDWQAVIVGNPWDAPHVAALHRQVAKSGLGDRLRIAGALPDAELAQLYRRASLFALATRYEGYGIVFDEALAHGLPIVSCRTGAVPDTVPEDAGLLVPPDDCAAFAAALAAMLDDPARMRTMAHAAAQAGAALPGWDDTARIANEVLGRIP